MHRHIYIHHSAALIPSHSIKKAIPPHDASPVFAVKFINKSYAIKHGKISAKQIAMEVSLHSHIGQHPNIIEWFATGENDVWKWIAMEYAEGGDLFDKIEADVGVSENIAHFYFLQLVSGVNYMHMKGVGHRDIKPENILLSDRGDLKIADFGLATLFQYQGRRKESTTMCGSPPYIAPEVITCAKSVQQPRLVKGKGYAADLVDIWSCGVVLFVLLVGNTPWDEPTEASWEFQEYNNMKGRTSDDLWSRLPSSVLSLLRGMMCVDTSKRFSFEKIRQHPWYTRKNPLLTLDGKMANPLHLATNLLANLKIDFTTNPTASQRSNQLQDSMELDSMSFTAKFSSTQPQAPISDVLYDWERPPRLNAASNFSSSQPTRSRDGGMATMTNGMHHDPFAESLAAEPSMSQFSAQPGVPISLTQHARRFKDIVPSYSLTRFFSHFTSALLVQILRDALHKLNVPVPADHERGREGLAWFKVRTPDGRGCAMSGDIVIDSVNHGSDEFQLLEVRFVKVKGDPLEWRRFFKKVVVLCREGVYVPEEP